MKIVLPFEVKDSGSFTRASTATYFDKNLNIQTAAINERRIGYDPNEGFTKNELWYSNLFTNSYWTKAAVSVSAFSSDIAPTNEVPYLLSEDSSSGTHALAGTNQLYNGARLTTLSFLVKRQGRTWVGLGINFADSGANVGYYFNLLNGTKGRALGGGAPQAYSIKAYSDDWYRISVTVMVSGIYSPRLFLATSDGGAVYDGVSSVPGVLVASAMLEPSSSVSQYIPTNGFAVALAKSAASELIEPTRTNLINYSDIEGTIGSLPVGASEYLSPFRVTSENYLGSNLKGAKHTLSNADTNLGYFNFPVTSGKTYTVSAWVFIPEGFTNFFIGIRQESAAANTYLNTNDSSQSKFGRWQRLWCTAVAGFTGYMAVVLRYTAAGSIPSSQFGAVFYSDCWQAEEGDTVTSWIPTAAAPVTRAADIQSSNMSSNVVENDSPLYNATTPYILGDEVILPNHKVYKSLVGGSNTVTISIGTAATITWPAHGRTVDDPIVFTSTGSLPANILPNKVYYVKTVLSVDTFSISATKGGTAVSTSSGTQVGLHTAYYSPNFGTNPATNATTWLDLGYTNRWKMFDTSVQSQTVANGKLGVTVFSKGYVNTVCLLNVTGTSVRVTAKLEGNPNAVYDVTRSLVKTSGINNLFNYFFKKPQQSKDILFEGLPRYANLQITIVVENDNGDSAVGACIVGQSIDLSGVGSGKGTAAGAKLGFTDYSKKDVDDFGNYSVLERTFSKRNDYTVMIANSELDYIYNLFIERRAKPTLYIGSKYESTYVYGFYKDFDIDIAYPDYSVASVTLESLT